MEISYKNEDLKISYAITVCNELVEIQRLVSFIDKHKRPQDDIVILFDSKNGSLEVRDYLKYHYHLLNFSWYEGEFNRNFADWKNKLIGLCKGDFIFNIDADEIPHETLILHLHDFIELNPSVDAYWVPRINTLEGDEYEIDQYVTTVGWRTSLLPSMVEEDILDLDNPKHLKKYKFLKEWGFLMEESKFK